MTFVEARCPDCHMGLEPEDGSLPEPGDVTFCLGCGQGLIVDDAITLRRLTAQDTESYSNEGLAALAAGRDQMLQKAVDAGIF